jgi:hypothetical protein
MRVILYFLIFFAFILKHAVHTGDVPLAPGFPPPVGPTPPEASSAGGAPKKPTGGGIPKATTLLGSASEAIPNSVPPGYYEGNEEAIPKMIIETIDGEKHDEKYNLWR